ncbi:Ras-related protein Rab-1 [Diplonema papillatum]|nr:Ras-related protein Rab-1 [Diplonema papillatum]
MQCSNVDTTCKVIVVGNGVVGKSSMLRRYCKNEFLDDYQKTIGTDYMMKLLHIDETDEDIQLDLWDTAGQEEYADLTAGYYRNAGACVLAFSTTDRSSFEAIELWKKRVERIVDPPPAMCLVQTKVDLMESAAVSPEECDALARRLNLHFIRTSTKENFNVDKVFMHLAKAWLASGREAETAAAIEQTNNGTAPPKNKASKEFATEQVKTVSLVPVNEKGKSRAKSKKRTCAIL